MKTNFFSELKTILDSTNVNLTISKKNDTLSILVDFSNGENKELQPVIISGTIEECDESFFTVLSSENQKQVVDSFDSLNSFKKMLKQKEEEARKKLMEKKAKSGTITKQASPSTNENENEDEDEEIETNTEKVTKPIAPNPQQSLL